MVKKFIINLKQSSRMTFSINDGSGHLKRPWPTDYPGYQRPEEVGAGERQRGGGLWSHQPTASLSRVQNSKEHEKPVFVCLGNANYYGSNHAKKFQTHVDKSR